MAHFNKVGLIILSDDQTKFMSVVKDNFTSDFILPGGRIEEGESDKECLSHPKLSPILRNKIVPDLIARKILK